MSRRGMVMVTALVIGCVAGAGTAQAEHAEQCTEAPFEVTAWWPARDNAFDLLGGWPGILQGDAGFDGGTVDRTLQLDGAGDFVEVADPEAGDFGAEPFAVAFWMSSYTEGSGPYLLGKSHPDGRSGWDVRLDARTIQLVGFNGWAVNLTTGQVIETDSWHHIAVTSDGASVTRYVDGETDPAWTIPQRTISTSPNPLRFGFTSNFGGSALDGQLDEIMFFDRALSAAEVRVICDFNAYGLCRPWAALPESAVAWWRLEGNGDDAIGHHNAVLNGGVDVDDGQVGGADKLDGGDEYLAIADG